MAGQLGPCGMRGPYGPAYGVADPDFALDERRERRVDDGLVGVLTVTIA